MMTIIEKLQDNWRKCDYCIKRMERSFVVTRLFDKNDQITIKLRSLQNKGNDLVFYIENLRDQTNRIVEQIKFSRNIDQELANIAISGFDIKAGLLSNFHIPTWTGQGARSSLEKLNQDINRIRPILLHLFTEYNIAIHDLRAHVTRPFNFSVIKGYPSIHDLPIVLDLTNSRLFELTS